MKSGIPIVLLAGSDRRAPMVPPGGEGYRFVVGYKGAEIQVGGRALVSLLDERLRSSSLFGEVYLAGPARRFKGLVTCPIIDTDRDVGRNIRAAVEKVCALHGRHTPIAFMASDILPDIAEIDDLGGRLIKHDSDAARTNELDPPFFAMALVEAPGNLGASSWKPRYGIRPHPGEPPHPYLPAHLAVIKPAFLRMRLLYRMLQLTYEVRNRDFGQRRRVILPRIAWALLKRDAANVMVLRAPSLTYKVLRHGLEMISRWRRGDLDLQGMARGIAAVIVQRKVYRRWGATAVRLVATPHQSFAKDLDTVEEVDELNGTNPG